MCLLVYLQPCQVEAWGCVNGTAAVDLVGQLAVVGCDLGCEVVDAINCGSGRTCIVVGQWWRECVATCGHSSQQVILKKKNPNIPFGGAVTPPPLLPLHVTLLLQWQLIWPPSVYLQPSLPSGLGGVDGAIVVDLTALVGWWR